MILWPYIVESSEAEKMSIDDYGMRQSGHTEAPFVLIAREHIGDCYEAYSSYFRLMLVD